MMSHYSCMDMQDQNPSRPSSLGIRLNSGVQNFNDMKNAQRSSRTYQIKRDGQDIEKVLGQINNNGSTPITPTSFLNPKEITADQEHFADQLSKSFDRLKNEREGSVSSILMPLVSSASVASQSASGRGSGEDEVPVSAASPQLILSVKIPRQIKPEMPQHSSNSIPTRMDEDMTDSATMLLPTSISENVLYNLMPPQQQHGSPNICLSNSSCGGAILSNCSSSTSSTSPPPPSIGENSATAKQQLLQHQFADEELMHLPHLNHQHHQFNHSNRPPSLSLPPLGSQQTQEDEDTLQQQHYPELIAATQGLCDVLQQHHHHNVLIGGDGDDRTMPTLLSSIAASTNNSNTTDTFMNLFNSQNNGDQNGLISDGMDQHMRNLNPRLTAANLINYGLQDSSIQMLRPQQNQHQDFMQQQQQHHHHHQSTLLIGTGMTVFPDLQQEQLAHIHQQQQQQTQLQQTSTNSSPSKPTTIAAAARKRALSNAPAESMVKKRQVNNRRRHEPTIAAAQALVNATVVGGNYSLGGCGYTVAEERGGPSMLDNCRIPLKAEATTPRRHFDADVDDTSTRSSSVPPLGENGEPVDQSMMKVEKKRARNRLAARRCRERKVTRIQTLEQEVDTLTAYVNRLKTELDHSRNETNQLRLYLDQISESFPNLSEKLKTIAPVVTGVQKPQLLPSFDKSGQQP